MRLKVYQGFNPADPLLVPTPGLGQACTRQGQQNLHGGTVITQNRETHQSRQNEKGWRAQSIQSYGLVAQGWNWMNWGGAHHHGSSWETWCLMKNQAAEYTLKSMLLHRRTCYSNRYIQNWRYFWKCAGKEDIRFRTVVSLCQMGSEGTQWTSTVRFLSFKQSEASTTKYQSLMELGGKHTGFLCVILGHFPIL